jgi:hypothetical protein
VKIEHPGEFTEILPLLVSPNDKLILDENQILLKCEKGNLIIQLSGVTSIHSKDFETDLIKKKCRVIEVKTSKNLSYEILFE